MTDTITKFRILIGLLRAAYHEWLEQIWMRGLDEPYCCDGIECGCEATTYRQLYEHYASSK